mgnify:CR=1 FL=1
MGKMFWIVLAILFLLLCVYCVILLNRMVSLSEKLQKNRKACILVKAGILVGIILLVAFCKASIAFFFYAAIVSLCMEPIYFLFRKRKGMQFLKKSALIPIAVGVIITVVGFFLMRHFVRTEYVIETAKLPAGQEYQILFISDLHYGNSIHKKQIDSLVAEWREEEWDAVIIGGDLIDENTSRVELTEVLSAIGTIETKEGIFCVNGNHDGFSLEHENLSIEEYQRMLDEYHIIFLQDAYRILGFANIVLFGRKDRSEQRISTLRLEEELLVRDVYSSTAIPGNAFRILIDHQPNALYDEAKEGFDLTLCGHTHAGQFWPIGLFHEPFHLNDLVYGIRQFDDMTAIVSSGLSGWYAPIRTEGPSEYVVITIRGTGNN